MNASVQTIDPLGPIYLVGVGTVGQAIARAHLDAGVAVYLVEPAPEQLATAIAALRRDHPHLVVGDQAIWDGETAQVLVRRAAEDPLPQPDRPPLLIESIVERRDAKRALLATAERLLGPEAILATNTSTLRLADIATDLEHPERFLGLHFFMPVHLRPLVEVVRGEATGQPVIAAACAHAARLAKPALVVADAPGFVVNRMLVPYLSQALHALCRGTPADQLERVARAAGMPLSPLELMDLIGMETAFHAGRAFWQAFPQRIDPSPLLPAMIKRGLLGVRSGTGFYDYPDGRRSPQLSRPAAALCEQYTRHPEPLTDQALRDRLLLPMMYEAVRIVRDRVVDDLAAIDTAMTGGLGMPASRGFWGLWRDESPTALAERAGQLARSGGRTYQPPRGLLEGMRAENSVLKAAQRAARSTGP